MDHRCGVQTMYGTPCRRPVPAEHTKCWRHAGPICSVCLAPMTTQGTRTLECNHTFHLKCLDRWKRSCTTPDPTCPMCRVPFDIPTYRCRLIVERTVDSQRISTDFETTNVSNIAGGFGLDFRQLVPNDGRFIADIHFDIEPGEILNEILTELGLPTVTY